MCHCSIITFKVVKDFTTNSNVWQSYRLLPKKKGHTFFDMLQTIAETVANIGHVVCYIMEITFVFMIVNHKTEKIKELGMKTGRAFLKY